MRGVKYVLCIQYTKYDNIQEFALFHSDEFGLFRPKFVK